MPRVSTLAMLTLYFVVFVDFLQLTLVFPLLPGIVEGFGYGAFPALGMHHRSPPLTRPESLGPLGRRD